MIEEIIGLTCLLAQGFVFLECSMMTAAATVPIL